MDPKALENLDPKLKETYERIMGTASNGNTTNTPPTNLTTPPTQTSTEPTPLTNQPPDTNSFAPASFESPTTTTTPDPTLNPDGLSAPPQIPSSQEINTLQPEPLPPTPASTPASSSPLAKTLYIVAGIIFFAIYTFFWLKIFNFPLPF